MHRLIILIGALAVILSASSSFGDDVSRRKTAEELLIQLKTDKNIEQAFSQMKDMQPGMLKAMGAPAGAMDNEFMGKMFDLMKSELSWDKLRDAYIDAYASVFTEDEMKDMINFYRSPSGLKFVDNMPLLMRKGMEIGQARFKEIFPKMMKLIEEYAKSKDKNTTEKN